MWSKRRWWYKSIFIGYLYSWNEKLDCKIDKLIFNVQSTAVGETDIYEESNMTEDSDLLHRYSSCSQAVKPGAVKALSPNSVSVRKDHSLWFICCWKYCMGAQTFCLGYFHVHLFKSAVNINHKFFGVQ